MTAAGALLARINSRLDEIEAGPAVIAVAVFLAAFIASLIWGGHTVIEVVLGVGFVWLAWNGGLLHSRVDEALDLGDENKGQIESVKTVLFGNETSTGKHSKGRAT